MVNNILQRGVALKQSLYRARRTRNKIQGLQLPKLTKEQEEMVRSVWGKVKIDTRWESHFNQFREEGEPWTPCYIPDTIQYGIIDMYYSDYRRCRVMEDKNLNSMLFAELKQPETVVRRVSMAKGGSVFLDENYHLLTREEAVRKVSSVRGGVIVKPSIDSGGGKGIAFFDENSSGEEIMRAVEKKRDMIVQQLVSQHSAMAAFNPTSLNTIRFVTFADSDGVHVLSAVARMGGGGAQVDNASSGGVFCGIHSDGTLRSTAHNLHFDSFEAHPSTGIVFKGYAVPGFKQCRDVVIELAPRFYGFSRLISWDMAIATDGSPMLIEANMTYGGADIPQIANGPLFGDLTPKVIREVFSVKSNVRLSKWL